MEQNLKNDHGMTESQNHRVTESQNHGQTENSIPPKTMFCGGYKNTAHFHGYPRPSPQR